jgi:hypothetical protein
MPVRNQHPAQLTVLQMDPRSAEILAAGSGDLRADAAYSSLFLAGAGSGNTSVMDGEILRTRVKGRVGLGQGFEAWTELPFAHTSGGFLDSFVIDWHDFWGLPDGSRSGAPQDQWDVRATRGGALAYEMEESGFELLDIPIGVAWDPGVFRSSPFDLLLRGAVEFPTGDQDRGFGNGEVDVSLGLVADYRWETWVLTAQVQHTFAGTPDRAESAGLEFRDISSFGLGVEIALGPQTSALVQSQLETSTLRDLGFGQVADNQWLLWFGVRQGLGDGFYLEVGFGEDLSSAVASDFTAWVGVGWTPSF